MGQRRWNALAPAPERSSDAKKRMRGESAEQVAIDACYHRACDRLANVDLEMLERMADATAELSSA
jgi:hypothetical protein